MLHNIACYDVGKSEQLRLTLSKVTKEHVFKPGDKGAVKSPNCPVYPVCVFFNSLSKQSHSQFGSVCGLCRWVSGLVELLRFHSACLCVREREFVREREDNQERGCVRKARETLGDSLQDGARQRGQHMCVSVCVGRHVTHPA